MLFVILTPLTQRSPQCNRKMGNLSSFYAFSLHSNRQMLKQIATIIEAFTLSDLHVTSMSKWIRTALLLDLYSETTVKNLETLAE